MAQVITGEAAVDSQATVHWRILAAATVIAAMLGLIEGFVGFALVTPGTSLVWTCTIVTAIALASLVVGWKILGAINARTSQRAFAVATILFGVAATGWTWAFAMPTAISLDASATPHALAALSGIGFDKSNCINVKGRMVGPLKPPYRQCAINGSPGSIVYFYAQSGNADISPYRGLIFSEAPENTFHDECVRHLVGHWYAFTGDPSGMTGYTCRGGP